MNYDLERVRELERKIEEMLSELSDICSENPSVNRNLEMLKADIAILKHSTLVE